MCIPFKNLCAIALISTLLLDHADAATISTYVFGDRNVQFDGPPALEDDKEDIFYTIDEVISGPIDQVSGVVYEQPSFLGAS